MKGKNISGKDYVDLVFGGLASGFGGMLINNDYDERKVARYGENESNLIVDTVYTSDTGCYETGIIDKRYYDEWIIVDEYETKKEAVEGHDKWVKVMTKTPPDELTDVFGGGTFSKKK